ncbi:BA75_02861T0 [Komagataella pastoris]|uniref:Succinate dehydrogenase assembly factor 2, mitochondrial n=1 Tax=Komagataella pastoris TaxID=4922 RepID=A0A1B2JAK2_PICPA|nr:BA75_02861T0 [Komagataella pastoris]
MLRFLQRSQFQGSKTRPRVFSKPFHSFPFLKQEELILKVEPLKRDNEPEDVKRRRLVYQSRKRGILETDLLLSRFAKRYLPTMSMEEMEEYDDLLNELDWDIYYWAVKNYEVTPLPEKWKDSKILTKLQEMSANNEGEILRMPNL